MASPSTERNREAQAHLNKAKEKLEAAKKLFNEGFYEDAASRAYYAMYHAARACLALEGSSPKTHEGVIAEFGRLFILTGKADPALGRALSAAKEDREDSEYNVYARINSNEANNVLRDAETFLAKAEEIVKAKA